MVHTFLNDKVMYDNCFLLMLHIRGLSLFIQVFDIVFIKLCIIKRNKL
jgi:hypothetical protein